MKKLVNIAVYFAIGLLAKTNGIAQNNADNYSNRNCSSATAWVKQNQSESNKRVFYVEGEYNSVIKLELKASQDVPLRVTIYDSKAKMVFEKQITQKGYHTLQFESTVFEVYKVVIETTSEVDFEVERKNYL